MSGDVTWIDDLWNFRMTPVPILLALLIAEAPMWARRATGIFYAPVYTTFLFESLNDDLTVYFGEDIVGRGVGITSNEAESIRRRLKVASFASMLLSALVIPAWAGLTAAAVLGADGIAPFMVGYVGYRAWRCMLSFRDFSSHAIATEAARSSLIVVYLLYTGLAAHVAYRSFGWSLPYVVSRNFAGLLGSVTDMLFGDLLVMACLVGAAASFFSSATADPQIREGQIARLRERQNELKKLSFAPTLGPAVGASTTGDSAPSSSGAGGDSGRGVPSSA